MYRSFCGFAKEGNSHIIFILAQYTHIPMLIASASDNIYVPPYPHYPWYANFKKFIFVNQQVENGSHWGVEFACFSGYW
jgi:hypothetical protein